MSTKSRFLSRRVPLIFALAALALALFAPQASARYVYTGNWDDGTVSVVDTATNQVVGNPIPVSEEPETMAITPNGKTLYVGADGGDDLTVIDTQSNQVVGSIPLAYEGTKSGAGTIAISPDGKTAFVTAFNLEGVLVIDLQTNQVVGPPIKTGPNPWGVAFSPDGSFAYVTDESEGELVIIDTAGRQVVGAIPVGEDPINVVFSPDGKTAYVVNEGSEDVSIVDVAAKQEVDFIAVGDEPWGIAISPNGSRVYVSNIEDNNVLAIDTLTRQVVGDPIPTGEEPYELAFTPDGKSVYVTNYDGDDLGEGEGVTVIDTATNQTRSIDVNGGPWQLAIVPDQSPASSFTAAASKANSLQIGFNSTTVDPDGSVAVFDWSFGDGATALNGGPTPSHSYVQPETYPVGLTTVDNEGCSTNMVFTGRTAYCSGAAAATQSLTVKAPNNFKFGKLIRNKKKGTAKLKVKVPYAGKLTLTGKKVKKVKRSAKKAGTVVLNIRPKPKAKKALAAAGSLKVRIKVTFKPTGGTARSKGRTVKLIRG